MPSAGALLQQIERERKPALPPTAIPERPPEPPAMKSTGDAQITVKVFRFAGNTLLHDEQLLPAVNSYLNRPLNFKELQDASASVASTYREAGWIVRAYLPRQEITGGVVTIQIVEAVFGGVRLEGPKPERESFYHVSDIIEAQQKAGEPFNAIALDRALLLASDLPGVSVTGGLSEGRKPGETDVLLSFVNKPLFNSDFTIDNTGGRTTGRERLTGNTYINSYFGSGEIISASYIHTFDGSRLASDGSDYIRIGFTHPIGLDGWRVGFSGSFLNYNLIAPEFTALGADGTSSTVGLEATYPLIRSRLYNIYLNANVDHKSFNNKYQNIVSSHYMSDSFSAGVSGNSYDNFFGGGANTFNLSLVEGILNLDGSPNRSADEITTRTAGNYTKIRFGISRQQSITEDISFFASYSGQWAGKNLDSSEKFYLGGSAGVRAYPANEGGGTDGHLINAELRAHIWEGITLTGFFDYGRILVNHDNSYAGSPTPGGYSLKGAGLSATWQIESGPTLKAIWAHRIGSNPNPTSTGNDQDGSHLVDRVWLSASMLF